MLFLAAVSSQTAQFHQQLLLLISFYYRSVFSENVIHIFHHFSDLHHVSEDKKVLTNASASYVVVKTHVKGKNSDDKFEKLNWTFHKFSVSRNLIK